jgi:hypothetical protein
MCKSATVDPENFFFEAGSVYKQGMYTTLVVVVNARPFLWKSQFRPEKSAI